MADFKTHITASTIVGIGYGYWGVSSQSMTLESGILAGGLCAVSGMLPDLDSDSGIPLRETSMFAAAVAPMLMLERFRELNLSHESMALAAMLIYVGIRFVGVEFFKRFTVHRGMWHSIPAAGVVGLVAYLAMPCYSESVRVYKSLAVVLGFLVHLFLDELWSLNLGSGRLRPKKSFGSALKLFGNSQLANIFVYAQVAILAYIAWGDTDFADRLRDRTRQLDPHYHIARPGSDPLPWDKWMPTR